MIASVHPSGEQFAWNYARRVVVAGLPRARLMPIKSPVFIAAQIVVPGQPLMPSRAGQAGLGVDPDPTLPRGSGSSYSSSPPNTLPVDRLIRCIRVQARRATLS
jgi:hypothetical protein